MNKKLISVIIPIYNSEKYLSECLDSVINQTYENLEIILVNDGSIDNSECVAKQYQNKDKRIRYFYKNNEGSGLTRNFGYEKSNGDYILFLDSDDYIDVKMIEKLYNVIQDNDSFSVMLQGYKVVGNDITLVKRNINEISLLRSPSVCIRLFNNKVLKKSGIIFLNNKIGEDLEFVAKLLIYNNKISYVDEPLFYYRIHDESTIQSSNVEDMFSIFESINGIEEYAKSIDKYEENKKLLEYINISHILYGTTTIIMRLDNYKVEDIKKCIDYVIKKYPLWYENEYINLYFKNEFIFINSLLEEYRF